MGNLNLNIAWDLDGEDLGSSYDLSNILWADNGWTLDSRAYSNMLSLLANMKPHPTALRVAIWCQNGEHIANRSEEKSNIYGAYHLVSVYNTVLRYMGHTVDAASGKQRQSEQKKIKLSIRHHYQLSSFI